MTVKPYQSVGPAAQTYGYGFGVGKIFGGTVSGAAATDLDGTLGDNTSGTTGSTDCCNFCHWFFQQAGGTIIVSDTPAVDGELIDYTAVSTNNLTVITRAVDGSTRSAHV